MRLLLRPIPRHFSRCGAKRDAAMLRLQLGHTHSLFFHWLYTCPKMSTPGWSTISTKGTVESYRLDYLSKIASVSLYKTFYSFKRLKYSAQAKETTFKIMFCSFWDLLLSHFKWLKIILGPHQKFVKAPGWNTLLDRCNSVQILLLFSQYECVINVTLDHKTHLK